MSYGLYLVGSENNTGLDFGGDFILKAIVQPGRM